jgi:hypothetical protein
LKKKTISLIITVLVLFPVIIHSTLAFNDGNKPKEEKETASYLVGFKNEADIAEFMEKKKLKEKKHKKLKHQKTISIQLTKSEVEEIQEHTDIAYIEEDAQVSISNSDDSIQSVPWGIQEIGGIEAQNIGANGTSIKIAILDTGIANHPDLAVKGGASFVEGADFSDDNGHGTHVAGSISALNNEMGVIGVAPEAEIYSLKVLDRNGSGSYSNVIQAIEWAIDNQINIISMSFGGNATSQSFQEAIKKANEQGILLIAAAGNAGSGTETVTYPALYPEVISVGAIDSNSTRATFSSTGNELDLMAPGVNILSTTMDGNFGFLSGTSMATPHVTGAAASYWSANPSLTNEQVKQRLLETAITLGDKHEYGEGKVNLVTALGLEAKPPIPEEKEADESSSFMSGLKQYEEKISQLASSFAYLMDKAREAGNEGLAKQIEEDYNILVIENRNLFKALDETFADNQEGIELNSADYYDANHGTFTKLHDYFNQKLLSYMNELGVNSEALLKDISAHLGQNLTLAQPLNISLDPGVPDVYTFIPSSTSEYQISASPNFGIWDSDDILLEVYSDIELSNLVASNNNGNYSVFAEIQTTLTAGHTYYVKIQSNISASSVYGTLMVSDTLVPLPLTLNTPLDVDVLSGNSKIFSFNTSVNGSFKISTTYFGGVSWNGTSDTLLYVYTDDILTKQIAYNDDANGSLFSEVNLNLAAGSTVYVKLMGWNSQSVHARVNVIKNGQSFTLLQNKQPIDVNVGEKQFTSYSFTPSISGGYQFYTGPIYGTGSSSDTYLYLYEDSNLTKLLASNDDWGGTRFSRIRYRLTAGKTYYLILNGYAQQAISTRLTINAGNQYFYDSQGKLDYVLLSDGRVFDYQYDQNGNLIKKVLQP